MNLNWHPSSWPSFTEIKLFHLSLISNLALTLEDPPSSIPWKYSFAGGQVTNGILWFTKIMVMSNIDKISALIWLLVYRFIHWLISLPSLQNQFKPSPPPTCWSSSTPRAYWWCRETRWTACNVYKSTCSCLFYFTFYSAATCIAEGLSLVCFS